MGHIFILCNVDAAVCTLVEITDPSLVLDRHDHDDRSGPGHYKHLLALGTWTTPIGHMSEAPQKSHL